MITFVVWVLASLALAAAVFLVANVMERRDGTTDGGGVGRFWRDFASGLWRRDRRTPAPAPVETDMDEFFAATIESAPGYVDADELTDVLHRARVQARSTLHVATVHRPDTGGTPRAAAARTARAASPTAPPTTPSAASPADGADASQGTHPGAAHGVASGAPVTGAAEQA
ncbi:hypothetical protein [Isoptericola sp. BMS4]|uniref:hypothetical protein n=1 Tax=Isoptericola sp. BMS4 TaxID=2527875 RepID=UPI001422CA16|nr:hypothetical protein [Isoptericola sp. BMS4]